jgi:hypothetical protein
MSTYQPPGGEQPERPPGYAEPQDPWAGGYEPGLASVPTDPIPHQDPYASYPAGDVWSQPTAAQGGPYGYLAPPPQRSSAGMIVLVVLLVFVLGGGGGFAAWYFTTQRTATTEPSDSPSVGPTADPTTTTFDPRAAKVGECVINVGTSQDPQIESAACSTKDSYTIVKVVPGADIERNPGTFDPAAASVTACAGTNYETWYFREGSTDDEDIMYCMTNN